LGKLPNSIGELNNLAKLELVYCNLRNLPDSFTQLNSLRCINLTGNPLDRLSPKVKEYLRSVDTVYGWDKQSYY
jgi:Leucine-rich repeat (LRR) protein